MSQLPFDVVEVIARILAEDALANDADGLLRATLARLNRVSKAVHEVTTAILYETTDYFNKEDFIKSVAFENPKGWEWTKYVFCVRVSRGSAWIFLTLLRFRYLSLGPISHILFYQQQRYLRGLKAMPDEDLDIASSFPRLRLACYLTSSARKTYTLTSSFRVNATDITLNLFKPMDFEELQSRCRPCTNGSWDIFGFYGIDPRFPPSPSKISSNDGRAGNVTKMVVEAGAGILPPANSRIEGRPWNVANRGTVEDPAETFRLVLRDTGPTSLTASTLHFILEFLEFSRSDVQHNYGHEPHLVLDCYPPVFASFVSSVSIDQARTHLVDVTIVMAARSGKTVTRSDRQTAGPSRVGGCDSQPHVAAGRSDVAALAPPRIRRG